MNNSPMSTSRAAARRRRRMFSTSITASSTTTPSATTRPPSVMVLRLRPKASRIHTVVSNASGMALKETNAPRQSRSVTSSSATTSTAPMAKRIAQFLDGAFDEARRPQQRRMVLHALLGQRRRERIEPLLQRPGDFQRIGAELRRGLDEDARLAGDQRIAEARLGAFAHRRHIAETHR